MITPLGLCAGLLGVVVGGCDKASSGPHEPTASESSTMQRSEDPQSNSNVEPTLSVLALVVEKNECVPIDRMPGLFQQLGNAEFRVTLGEIVAEGRGDPNQALTHWLILAAEYQELCGMKATAETNAAAYIEDSVPLPEAAVENALEKKQCRFLKGVTELGSWPYELRMSREVLAGDFQAAEITRRLWISVLEEYGTTCGGALSRRGKITIETQIERLNRIIGLDDPTLIDLRSQMIEALDSGDENKILALARAVSEREKALDSLQAAKYDAKLAAIEKKIADQTKKLSEVETSKLVEKSGDIAETTGNAAETAANVAETARAAKTTVDIVRSFF